MGVEIITKDDLREFKAELFSQLRDLLSPKTNESEGPRVVKSERVKKMLGCSDTALKTLRKQIGAEKIGGVWYYNMDDIKALMPRTILNKNEGVK